MKDIAITESLRVGRTPRKIIITFFGYPKSTICNVTRDILQSNPSKARKKQRELWILSQGAQEFILEDPGTSIRKLETVLKESYLKVC